MGKAKDVNLGKLSDWVPPPVIEEFLRSECEVVFFIDSDGEVQCEVKE